MKKISILIPCFNEEENIEKIVVALKEMFAKDLSNYDYELLFIDNASTDKSQQIIQKICNEDTKIKAIFNVRNFGQFNSPYYGLFQTTGDGVVILSCDFQDPISVIPELVAEWEKGCKIVITKKKKSDEKVWMRFMRKLYYRIAKKFSEVHQIEDFTGFGLYDREFLDVLKKIDDPTPFLRGLVAEFGYKIGEVSYDRPARAAGKTKNNFYSLYDAAMLSFTSYTKVGLRVATFSGVMIAIMSFIIGLIYLVMKLINWDSFSAGMAPMLIGVFFLGAVQLFFIGFLGEYIMAINERVKHRPLVIEEKRINFDK